MYVSAQLSNHSTSTTGVCGRNPFGFAKDTETGAHSIPIPGTVAATTDPTP